MKLKMTQKELDIAIREQGKSMGDVMHYRMLNGNAYVLVDHKKWDQIIDIEIVEDRR